jgi:hypothetical protein
LNGEPLPTIADAAPLCAVDEMEVAPTLVQPVRPFSKPPLVMPLGGGVVMVKVTVVLCVALGAVPVIVSVYVAAAAVPALTVNVELPGGVTEVGLRVDVAPTGVPPTVRVTVSAVPLVTAVEIVDVPLVP